ncbi:MAG: hypothetical protein FWD63_09465 [Propionibacteriaceae bacterium]|nr:hypothetical protein [Propionibacteriaceae bacterium]
MAGGNRNDRVWIVALAALTLVTAILVAIILRATGNSPLTPAIEDTDSSTPTVSAWNETSSPSLAPTPSSSWAPPPATPPPATLPQSDGQCQGKWMSWSVLMWCGTDGWDDAYVEGGGGQSYSAQPPSLTATTWFSTIMRTGQALDSAAAAQADADYGFAYDPNAKVQVVIDQPVQISGHDGWRRTCLLTGSAWGDIYTTIIIFDLGGAINAKGQVIDGWGAFRGMYLASRPDLGAAEEAALSTLTIVS